MTEEKCCGGCCWFFFEASDGYGDCANEHQTIHYCGENGCGKYVSREQMRHHVAVLLQATRWIEDSANRRMPTAKDYSEAIAFAYKYMKRFSKL